MVLQALAALGDHPETEIEAVHLAIALTDCSFMVTRSFFLLLCFESVSFQVDNEAIFGICKKYLVISQPSLTHLNRLIAQVVSLITVSLH